MWRHLGVQNLMVCVEPFRGQFGGVCTRVGSTYVWEWPPRAAARMGDLRGGRTQLPKFRFSAKFPFKIFHRFIRNFTNTDKKIRKWLLYYVKNYFNGKSIEVQRWTPLKVILNELCLLITRPCMQRSRTWLLPNWIGLYLPPLGIWGTWNLKISQWNF